MHLDQTNEQCSYWRKIEGLLLETTEERRVNLYLQKKNFYKRVRK